MENPDFDGIVQLKITPIPGENPELMAMMRDGEMEGRLGNLVDWITTGIAPERQPYYRLVMPDGTTLDHNDARDLAGRPGFRAWVASKH